MLFYVHMFLKCLRAIFNLLCTKARKSNFYLLGVFYYYLLLLLLLHVLNIAKMYYEVTILDETA